MKSKISNLVADCRIPIVDCTGDDREDKPGDLLLVEKIFFPKNAHKRLSALRVLVKNGLENLLVANLLTNRRNYRVLMFHSNSIDIAF